MSTRTLTCEVTIGQIKAALLFASNKAARSNLEGACIDHTTTGTRMVATDGHRAIFMRLNDTPVEGEPTRYVVGRDVLETIVKGWAKVGSVGFVWEQDAPTDDPQRPGVKVVSLPRVHAHGLTTADAQVAMGNFPPYEKLLPKKCSGKIAQFNGAYITDCAKARKVLGIAFPDNVAIAHNGDGPALVSISDSAFALVMPLRIDPEMSAPAWFTGAVAKSDKKAAA